MKIMNKITKILIIGLISTLSSGYMLYSSRKIFKELPKDRTYRFSRREQGAIIFLQKLIEETSSKREREEFQNKRFKEEPLNRDKILRDFLNKVINTINKCFSKEKKLALESVKTSFNSKINTYKNILTSTAEHMRNRITIIRSQAGRPLSKKTIAERYRKLFDYVEKLLDVYTQKNVIECINEIIEYSHTKKEKQKIIKNNFLNDKYWSNFFERFLKLIDTTCTKNHYYYDVTLKLNPEILKEILKKFVHQEKKVLFNNNLVKNHLKKICLHTN